MRRSILRGVALSTLLLAGVPACGTSDDDVTEPVADPGVTVGGLRFVLAGAGYSSASGALPAPDASVAAPVVVLNGSLGGLATATLNVSAAEPFQTVLLLPAGATSFARVVMPASSTLIGISTTRVAGSASPASVQVALIRGGRVSAPATLSLLTPVN